MAKGKKQDAAHEAPEQPGFEESLARLEEIVAEMEGGDLPLERALELFEEGTALGRACSRRLDEAERKITLLLEAADGTPREEEIEAERMEEPDEPRAPARKASSPRKRAGAPTAAPPPSLGDAGPDDDLPF